LFTWEIRWTIELAGNFIIHPGFAVVIGSPTHSMKKGQESNSTEEKKISTDNSKLSIYFERPVC